jgi:murein DD-endopeptidase MepM/ murein hydrolase activator NlpD
MKRWVPIPFLVACGGAATTAAPSAPPSPAPVRAPSLETTEAELVKRVNAKDGAAVVALFGAKMAEAFPTEKTGPFVGRIVDEFGRVVSSERIGGDGLRHGVYRWTAERGEWRVTVDIDAEAKVTGWRVTLPPVETPIAKSTIPLGLPLRGQWRVFWGGDTEATNRHVGNKGQRRAADLDAVGPDGADHRGDGKKNEDYIVYGREVLAVADGVVTSVVDGVWENEPGSMNRDFLPGNVVIIDHGNALYSMYAHLQSGKMRVKAGASVKRGEVLGLCGNSGNSSQPHLHFQLMDGPHTESATGIEAVFADAPVVRGGKSDKIAQYTFLKGDLVGEPVKK